jgi:hypothetical protein
MRVADRAERPAGPPAPRTRDGSSRGERGVGLMEIIVATVIAVIAILALAYTFGTGSGLVGRYAGARVGLAAAQRRLEILSTLPASAPELQLHSVHLNDIQLEGGTVARETWTVNAWDDPADGVSGDVDLKRVRVNVRFGQGPNDTLSLTRLFPLW